MRTIKFLALYFLLFCKVCECVDDDVDRNEVDKPTDVHVSNIATSRFSFTVKRNGTTRFGSYSFTITFNCVSLLGTRK